MGGFHELIWPRYAGTGEPMSSRALRRSDLVEIRSAGEILATLDENGLMDGLPFMPEMIAYCGRRLAVDGIADKLAGGLAQARGPAQEHIARDGCQYVAIAAGGHTKAGDSILAWALPNP